ncbi:MAG: Ig-like domain-containing protein [Bacteroidaceae bacterium]|nr:Ig-like domain-containing protein [Bacteroidaceae bacterium]
MNKQLLRILKAWLLMVVLMPLAAHAYVEETWSQGTIYLDTEGGRQTVYVPSGDVTTFNEYDGTAWSWSTNNSSLLNVQKSYKFSECSIMALNTNSWGDNNVELYFQYRFRQGSITYQYKLVWTVKLSGITLSETSVTLKVDDTKQLTATATPTSIGNNGFSWSSSDTSVATVSNTGLVTAVSVGIAKITCMANDGSGKSATCSVLVSATGTGGDNTTAPTEKWSDSGNYSIRWYKSGENEFTISTCEELAGLAYLVNNGYSTFSVKTIKLAADLDLGGKIWVPIGSSDDASFRGSFDGQNHTVANLYISNANDKQEYFGFFGVIKEVQLKI